MDLIAEQAVIGSLLREPAIVSDVIAVVDPADFAVTLDRRFFEAARALFREGSPVDAVLILGKLGLEQDKEAREYAAELMEVTPTAANWREYAALMHEQAVLRVVKEHSAQLSSAATLEDCRLPAQKIADALGAGRRVKSRSFGELLENFCERQEPGKPKVDFIETGFGPIDARAHLKPGKVMVIGGLPSDGKTAFALQIALHMAKRHSVGFFSLETDGETLTDRMVASGWQIDYARIGRQDLMDADWVRFAERSPEFEKRRLRVIEESRLSADQIAALSTAYGFEVIFIDYVQMLETTKERGVSRAEQLAEVSRQLHVFAQSSGTLVVELAQLKTPDRKDTAANPDMFDLGESSQFGKDADVILTLARPGKEDRVSDEDETSRKMNYDKTRKLKIAKNKDGERGRVKLYFDGGKQTFYLLGQEPSDHRPGDKKPRQDSDPGQVAFEDVENQEGMPF